MEPETRIFSSTIISALRAKGLTIERLGQMTGISERFLESLVQEKFEVLPALPYVRGYLMKVAQVLDLDGERLWQDYLKDNEAIKRSGEKDRLPENRFATPKVNAKLVILILIILGLGFYVLLRTPLFGSSNGLVFYNLTQDITYTEEPTFKLLGRLDQSYKLTLNGKRIYPDEEGKLEETIPLQEGFNTLVFSIKKILGKERTFTKQIFYKKLDQQSF